MSMPATAAATTGTPFDGDSDISGTVLESMNESLHSESFDESSGPILPPLSKMASEEGFALREWRRLNAIRLAEKEKEEKAMLREIIDEADEFKREFYKKRLIVIENRKTSNREKQEQYLANQARFHVDAQKSYWKAIAELIPYEVPTIEKKGKRNTDKQPTITVITGPKPGKPTDMSRMWQVLMKLKHNPPPHMNPKSSSAEAEKDTKTEPTPAVADVSGNAGTNAATSASPEVAIGKGSTSKPL